MAVDDARERWIPTEATILACENAFPTAVTQRERSSSGSTRTPVILSVDRLLLIRTSSTSRRDSLRNSRQASGRRGHWVSRDAPAGRRYNR